MAAVDITGGASNIARGAALGADVAMQHGQAMARGYEKIGDAAAGAVQNYAKARKDQRHLDALRDYGNSIGANAEALHSGDPQVMTLAIGKALKDLEITDARAAEAAKEDGRRVFELIKLGLEQDFSADSPQRTAAAQSDLEAWRAQEAQKRSEALGGQIGELRRPAPGIVNPQMAASPYVTPFSGWGKVPPSQGLLDQRAAAGRPGGGNYMAEALKGAHELAPNMPSAPRPPAPPKWDETPEGYRTRKAIDREFAEPPKAQETPEERARRIEMEEAARARGRAAGTPPRTGAMTQQQTARATFIRGRLAQINSALRMGEDFARQSGHDPAALRQEASDLTAEYQRLAPPVTGAPSAGSAPAPAAEPQRRAPVADEALRAEFEEIVKTDPTRAWNLLQEMSPEERARVGR